MFNLFGGLFGGGLGGIGGLILPLAVYGIFFTINLVIQLVTGGLSDLFPTETPV